MVKWKITPKKINCRKRRTKKPSIPTTKPRRNTAVFVETFPNPKNKWTLSFNGTTKFLDFQLSLSTKGWSLMIPSLSDLLPPQACPNIYLINATGEESISSSGKFEIGTWGIQEVKKKTWYRSNSFESFQKGHSTAFLPNTAMATQEGNVFFLKDENGTLIFSMTVKRLSEGFFLANPFQCPVCVRSCTCQANLNIHLRTHTGEKPFRCQLCSKAFTTKGGLSRHSLTHTKEKPHKCPKCPKTFVAKCDFRVHLQLHNGERPFECPVCFKSCTRKANLVIHLRTHTGEKPYQCSLCPKGYASQGALTYHRRTHTGEKPYLCLLCSKGFYSKSALTYHCNTKHTVQKPFQCSLCPKVFVSKNGLRYHSRAHTLKINQS